MKKLSCLALLILSTTAFAYTPAQLLQFQNTGTCPGCDLSNAYLIVTNMNIVSPYNLQGANISDSTYETQNNTGSNFSNIIAFNTAFDGYSFTQSNFQNALLKNAIFANTNLQYADFTGADITGANFNNANLYRAKGLNLTASNTVCNAILPDGSTGKCGTRSNKPI